VALIRDGWRRLEKENAALITNLSDLRREVDQLKKAPASVNEDDPPLPTGLRAKVVADQPGWPLGRHRQGHERRFRPQRGDPRSQPKPGGGL
jgi:hypothetical protein